MSSRPSGIAAIGAVPWGTHFCQFYETKQDLADVLGPYFKAGLEAHEHCMWVTSEPLTAGEARAVLRGVLPSVDRYLDGGQLEILPYTAWYLRDGQFDAGCVLEGWRDRLNQALARGLAGLRLTGNTFWLEGAAAWQSFMDYEAAVDRMLGRYAMLALCTYALGRCGATEILDVIKNHEFALIKRSGRWDVIQSQARKELQAALRASEEKYERLFHGVPVGIAVTTLTEGRFLDVNEALLEMGGYRREDLLGRTVHEVAAWGRPEARAQFLAALTATGRVRDFEATLRRKSGAPLTVLVSAHILPVGQEPVIVSAILDISDRVQAEAARRESQARYHDLFTSMEEGFALHEMLFDLAGAPLDYRFLEVNPAFSRLTGLKAADVVGRTVKEVLPDIEPAWIARYGAIVQTGRGERFQAPAAALGRWYEGYAYPVGGRRFAVTFTDITDRKAAEAALRQSLADKEALLREVNHRVKNNLQMLCDLLYLQMEGTADADKEGLLRETYGRIYAIARLHEQLYQSMESGQVHLPTYLGRLVGGFEDLYTAVPITLDAPTEDLALDVDRAIHVGLILTELLTNAMKHAFVAPGILARVDVTLRVEGDAAQLRVRDTGIGLPKDLDIEHAKSLGLRIVHILARRLNAAVEIESTEGTTFTLTFPRHADAPREPSAT
ncbi:MAG: MEDS domain-containing protein [Candidatus Methylomirabilales bacterium]